MSFQVSLNNPPPHPLCQSLCISDGTQGYKGCYLFVLVFFVFFLSCFSLNFFSAVVFLFVHWDVGGPFYFLFFLTSILSLFVLFFFLHAFFCYAVWEKTGLRKIVWKDIVYIWLKEFVVGLMMLLLFLHKALILGKI